MLKKKHITIKSKYVIVILMLILLPAVMVRLSAIADTTSNDKDALLAIPTSLEKAPISPGIAPLPEYVVIVPSEQATFSSETTARVSALPVKEGSIFKQGETLIKLDCTVQEADLKKAVAVQNEAAVAFESAKKLKAYGAISEFEFIQAKTQRSLGDAEVEKLTSIVRKCNIDAPYNGAVSKVMVHLYETVKPGDPLIKVVSIDDLDFIIQVPSSWLQWLHIGSPIKVNVNEIGKSVDVVVSKINPEISSVSQTVKIIAKEHENSHEPALLPGMSGQAYFPEKPRVTKNPIVKVPNSIPTTMTPQQPKQTTNGR